MIRETRHTAYGDLIKNFDLKTDAPLKKFTSFKVGGPADLLSVPETRKELEQLLKTAEKLNIPVTFFGGGTNILITDKGIRGLVIITRQLRSDIKIIHTTADQVTVSVDTGHHLASLCRYTVDNALTGLEFAAGIPGTVGGAIAMNAGTPAGQMSDIIKSIDVWNCETQQFITLKKEALRFSYRHLEISDIIVKADVELKKGDKEQIRTLFDRTLANKKDSQPVSQASAGCFFKNPESGMPAGELIEKAGLKGTRINDAMVSELHANYIVNLNNAASSDILKLKQQIQETVFKKFNINLETEVRIEGE